MTGVYGVVTLQVYHFRAEWKLGNMAVGSQRISVHLIASSFQDAERIGRNLAERSKPNGNVTLHIESIGEADQVFIESTYQLGAKS